jgi:ParB-like chromosome segregation protein Spo0J
MAAGAKFPPVVVFHGGRKYWLADGFHRVDAAEAAGLDKILAEVRKGERRDWLKGGVQ